MLGLGFFSSGSNYMCTFFSEPISSLILRMRARNFWLLCCNVYIWNTFCYIHAHVTWIHWGL